MKAEHNDTLMCLLILTHTSCEWYAPKRDREIVAIDVAWFEIEPDTEGPPATLRSTWTVAA